MANKLVKDAIISKSLMCTEGSDAICVDKMGTDACCVKL